MAGSLLYSTAQSLKPPQINGRWFCFCPESNIPGGGLVDQRRVLVERINTPYYKTQPVSRPAAGSTNNYPGPATIDGLSISFFENEDFDVTGWLQTWMLQVYDPDTGWYGIPLPGGAGYLRTFMIEFYPNSSQTASMVYKYTGCIPHDQSPFDLNYAEIDGRLVVTANFSVRSSSLKRY